MRQTILPGEMQALEKAWMKETGVPGILLMEQAARGVAEALVELCPRGRALFLCGPGNNGGDGYAAARIWQETGGRAEILELNGAPRGDAAVNRLLALQAGIPVRTLEEAPHALPPCDAVVDALFGTGLARPVEGVAAGLTRLVNASGRPVLAVDIPSGLSGETGLPMGETVRAEATVTFHRVKAGLVLRQGPRYTGRLILRPILIPQDWGDTAGLRWLSPDDLPALMPPRPFDAHKGSMGKALIFAGSPGMAGAAAWCARACVRAGAGLTMLLCRASILPILQTLVPEAVCRPLPEENGRLGAAAVSAAEEALAWADKAAVGCGLGLGEDLLPLLRVFARCGKPVVWDADALTLLSRHRELLPLPPVHILTPHAGEAARLLEGRTEEIAGDPPAALEALQARCGCHVLLKGPRTLMHSGEARAVNLYASPALAKGGSGDILTGVLTAVLGQRGPVTRDSILTDMQLAALVHGLAGIRAAGERGERCVTPEDLVAAIRL